MVIVKGKTSTPVKSHGKWLSDNIFSNVLVNKQFSSASSEVKYISTYRHTYIHDFILSRIYRVAQKLISSRKEKNTNNKITLLLHNNKITLLSINFISINAKYYERRWFVLDV